ncbi:MAG: nucleoside monophosphate kinase, partial [Candidatus Dependentiae bacterium]|nr:nucleoside monophosphate kinase [Candidatus Dependentiae bacterium]
IILKGTGLLLCLSALAFCGGCRSKKTGEQMKNETTQKARDLFIFFGPPACGKGTLAARLKDELKFITVSTGDVLRQNVSQKTELGQKAQPLMARGELVPDTLINAMVGDWLIQQAAGHSPIILDGYPRTVGQAEALLELLKDPKNSAYRLRIVRFGVSEQEAVDRILYRVVCSNKACQKVYSLKALKPKVEGICDVCGSPLTKRSDDTEEVIRKRYNDYMKSEAAMLGFFKSHGVEINDISAEGSMDEVYSAFKKLLQ